MTTILIALVVFAAVLSVMAVAFSEAGWRQVKHLREVRDTQRNKLDELRGQLHETTAQLSGVRERLHEAKERLAQAEAACERLSECEAVMVQVHGRLREFEAKYTKP